MKPNSHNVMNIIPTKIHGVLDYLSGPVFIASPWLFGFADGGAAQWAPIVAGIAILLLSVLTNYEAGLYKRIPMTIHLTLDVLLGVLLIASPWLMGFADYTYQPHVVLGAIEVGAALLTQRTPSYEQTLTNTHL